MTLVAEWVFSKSTLSLCVPSHQATKPPSQDTHSVPLAFVVIKLHRQLHGFGNEDLRRKRQSFVSSRHLSKSLTTETYSVFILRRYLTGRRELVGFLGSDVFIMKDRAFRDAIARIRQCELQTIVILAPKVYYGTLEGFDCGMHHPEGSAIPKREPVTSI